ncbi:MAG TPA: deoxyribodipyrimidine photo-lyase, partial [Polyangiaceae bacterium]|nr:deoxyribodipyrimidine photo-lyase [Polyangiaceae bacterium]
GLSPWERVLDRTDGSEMTERTIVWFRGKDLRVSDHAPLRDALAVGEVIPLFVLDPHFFAPDRARELPHRMQFLLDSLRALAAALEARGSRLLVVAGKSVEIVPLLARKWKADRVVAQRWVEPMGRERDRRIREALGAKFELFEGETLMPPGLLRTGAGAPYSVFSQFARVFRQTAMISRPLPAPRALPPLPRDIRVREAVIPTCEQLGIDRNPAVLAGGERAAKLRLRRFLRNAAAAYSEQRDRMDLAGTSRLSADLKFGTLSVCQVWSAVKTALGETPAARCFLNELVWREFSHSTLWDRPELLEQPFRPGFVGFPWRYAEGLWQAWVTGNTGYPIVDAASRQLLGEGFVHNRARMITASFLTKHLLIDYRRGEAHYMKYLTDGDWAQNNAGWQWSAGCGCDAQPYFRIFNPIIQGKRFDPAGDYVRRWVPELAQLPARHIHHPWEAPDSVLRCAGVRLDETYPRPIVDHRFARERFLATAAKHLKRRSSLQAQGAG